VRVIVNAHVIVILIYIMKSWNGRRLDMSPSAEEYSRLLGNINIEEEARFITARCSAFCASCTCKIIPDVDEINW
jgi:hypothetical protein